LSFFDVIAFLNQDPFNYGAGRSVGFKVVDRFNFPLVEIRLRILPRVTFVVMIGTESSRDANDASRMTAAIAPAVHKIHRRWAKKPDFRPF
jgi:hypothetical protein